MKPSPRLWMAAFVGMVFVIGASAGVLIDRTLLVRPPSGQPPADVTPPAGRGARPGGPLGPPITRVMNELTAELQLSDAQRARVSGILESQRARVQQIQEQTRERFTEEQRGLQAEISAVLTPEQASRFLDLLGRRPGALGNGPGMGPGGRGPGRGLLGRGPGAGGAGRPGGVGAPRRGQE